MREPWQIPALGILVSLSMSHVQSAQGATLPIEEISNLASAGTFTYDGLAFTISGCSYVLNGASQTDCSAADIEVEVSASNRGSPTIEFLGNGNGSNSAALSGNPSSGKTTDVVFTLAVAPVASGQPGYKAGTTLTTVSSALVTSAPTGGTSVFSDVTCTTGCSSNSVNADTTNAALTNALSTASNSISLSVELGLTGNRTGTLTLNNNSLHFSPAPEPASLLLLTAGLTGLAAARRRVRRNRPTS